jgi:hypothetical protein
MWSSLLCESRGRARHFASKDSSRLNHMPSTSSAASSSRRARRSVTLTEWKSAYEDSRRLWALTGTTAAYGCG